jgi:pilus assembly protein CpaE
MPNRICIHNLRELCGQSIPGYVVVANTTVQQELLTALTSLELDAVVLDLDEANAVGTMLKMREVKPRIAVVGVTAEADARRLINAQRAGCTQATVRPVNLDDLAAALRQALGQTGASEAASQTFGVLGSVGGAGSTTIATYLAVEIATLMREATALFDLDLEGGGVAEALDLTPQYTIADLASAGVVDSALLEKASTVLANGVHVFARPHTILAAHGVEEAALRSILQAAHNTFPYVVLDLPRHLSPLAGAAIEHCTRLVLVVQLTVPSLRSTQRIIDAITAEGLSGKHIELVVNRYRKNTTNCTIEMVERQFGRRVLAVVPSDFKSVHTALDSGQPLVRRNAVRAAIREMAARLTGFEEHAKGKTWLPKLGLGN